MKSIGYYEKFDSIEQMLSNMATRGINEPWSYRQGSIKASSGFAGTNSWEEACDLAVNGDENSWKLLSDDLASVQASKLGESYKARIEYAVCGGCVDVPRYLSGNPMCMAQRVRKKGAAKVINLIYNIVASANVDKSDLSRMGAKVLRTVQLIEQAGVKVNLYVATTSRSCVARIDRYAGCIVRIKPSNVGVSPYNAAFGLVNPSMLRRLMFRWFETMPELPQDWSSSYGCAVDEDMYQDRNLGKYAYISYGNDNSKSVQEIVDEVISQLSKR